MSLDPQGIERYETARARALREDLLGRLTGKRSDLLPYEAVVQVLKNFEHRQLTELRSIPLDNIIGSVGRYRDFTRSFLPRRGLARGRWVRIDMALNSSMGIPPIEVYQIGQVYFVRDGNHRVSVARANGLAEIEAYVTLIPGVDDLQVGDSLDAAIIKAERSHFLAQTRLAELPHPIQIDFTKPGGYPRLLEQIYAHHLFMGLQRSAGGISSQVPITIPEAARSWYVTVYLPIIEVIQEQGMVKRFSHRTTSDLYVWMADYIGERYDQQGKPIDISQEVPFLGKRTRAAASVQALMRRLLKWFTSHNHSE